MNYNEWLKRVGIYFLGMLAGIILMALFMVAKYDTKLAEMESTHSDLAREVKTLKLERMYILKYAMAEYEDEKKAFDKMFKKE